MRYSPALTAAVTAFLSLVAAAAAAATEHYEFTTVTGYFLQDESSTNATDFDYTAQNFGLINRAYDTDRYSDPYGNKTQWQRFVAKVDALNVAADNYTSYKLFFMARHGEGYHNVAESYYGTQAWNCYWGLRDGNKTTTWADAQLTPVGQAQAQLASRYWDTQVRSQRAPFPMYFFVSPLTRSLKTANLTFAPLLTGWGGFRPEVMEYLREGVSGRTCDRRGTRSYILGAYPMYRFESGFAEQDPLWRGLKGEPGAAQEARTVALMNDIWGKTLLYRGVTSISFTSHSGEIATILRVIGHREFRLNTGSVIPVLVKGRRVAGEPSTTTVPYTAYSPVCSTPPPLPSATAA